METSGRGRPHPQAVEIRVWGSLSWAVPEPRQPRSETKSRCKSSRLRRWRPCASALRALGWRRAGRAPGALGPSGCGRPDAAPSRHSVCAWPRRRAESSRGGAARHFPARKLLSSRQRGEQETARPGAPELLRARGALRGHSGATGTCPKRTLAQSSTRSTFLVLGGHFLQWCFVAPATCLQRFGRKGARA